MEENPKKSDKPSRQDFYANFIEKLQQPKSIKLKDKFVKYFSSSFFQTQIVL